MELSNLFIIPLAFICEFVDSSLGMGYGTALTPLLLLMGFEPMEVVPAVLFSEFITGLSAAVLHHNVKNVDFSPRSMDSKVALALSVFALVGVAASVIITIKLPGYVLKILIGLIVISMSIYLLANFNNKPRFSWRKIISLGTIASFNKGMSGGGYGPLVTGGQMLSGIGIKNAVGITSFSESVTCLAGILLYFILKKDVDWSLAPWLMSGALLSVPFAAITLKRIPEQKAKLAIAVVILFLGGLTLFKGIKAL